MRQKKEKENGKNRLNFMMIRLFLVFINTQFLKDTFKHQGLRKQLVSILKNKGINDKFVLDAIQNIPLHLFMDSSFLDHAYQDKAFPIGAYKHANTNLGSKVLLGQVTVRNLTQEDS